MASQNDSIAEPSIIQTVKRVSLVIAKHVSTGESWRKEAILSAHAIAERDRGGRRVRKRDFVDALPPQWAVCKQYSQYNFVAPRCVYQMPVAMSSGPTIGFAGHTVRVKRQVPIAQDIALFIAAYVSRLELEAENIIICLIYVERIMRRTDMHLLSDTWRPLMLCALLIATKIWQDRSPKNKDFSTVFPEFTAKQVSHLERIFANHVRSTLPRFIPFELPCTKLFNTVAVIVPIDKVGLAILCEW